MRSRARGASAAYVAAGLCASVAAVVGAVPQRPAARRGAAAAVPAAPLSVRLAARAMQPGELVVATIESDAPARRVSVRVFDRDVPAFQTDERRWQALIGIDLDVRPAAYTVAVGADGRRATARLVVRPKRFPTRQLRVDEAFVNPPSDVVPRILDDAKRLAALWPASSPKRLWSGPFARPVPQAANSAFGSRSVFNGQPRAPHGGADFLSPAGTPVASPNAGRVVLADDLYYTGNTVVIDHGLGLFSLFAHFSETDVRAGDDVTTGQIIGKVGATGRVTGPHLHWMVRLDGARIDPLSLIAELGGQAAPR